MSVVVEISTDALGDLRTMRATMTRVPVVDEVVRVLVTVNGLSETFWFKVTRVVHVAHTDAYPARPASVDAWVDGVSVDAPF